VRRALIVVGILLVAGCASLQKGTQGACQVLTSLDPAIGPVCLQVEEVESVIAHVFATRAMRAAHPEMAAEKVDICKAPLP
jgi:outer membrane murein-binding lipoprotein Lpp